ncbi:MAG: peptidylprolyl isomerase [Pseudomonadota bacterium]
MTRFLLAATTALLLPLPALAQDDETAAEPLPAELGTVLATVNDTEITLGHVIALRGNLPQQYQSLPPNVLLPGLLDQLIDQTLLAEAAEARGADQQPGIAISVENDTRAMLANLELQSIVTAGVTEEALIEAHAAAIEGMEQTPEFNASHILVESEELAADLITQLVDGADFATLAQEHSIGPSGPRGGALGWFGPGQMVPTFDEAVQALEVGEVSAPVETQFGWHVVILNDTRMSQLPTLDSMREDLTAQLRQDVLQTEINTLRDAAEISRPEGVIDPAALNTVELFSE